MRASEGKVVPIASNANGISVPGQVSPEVLAKVFPDGSYPFKAGRRGVTAAEYEGYLEGLFDQAMADCGEVPGGCGEEEAA